jgi:hypothetical protein
MLLESCPHKHDAPTTILKNLHESQAGKHRHKCCICAYHQGYLSGLRGTAETLGDMEQCHNHRRVAKSIVLKFPKSQAGEGRHKCAICAFHKGFEAGRNQKAPDTGAAYKGFGDESRKYQRLARQALPLLVAQAKARTTITYGQLALELEMRNPRNLNAVLGAIGVELKELGQEWNEKIPPINCLVLNKKKKTPQRGIEFYMSPKEFQTLSRPRQQEVLYELNRDIWDYPRWEDVLHYFNLEPFVPAKSKILQAIARAASYGRAGGETEDHRRLKEYVKENPQLVGLPKRVDGTTEHPFISADEVDVLFKCPHTWVGVEVKGQHADSKEIMRGIFQCIKYKALMEATQRYEQIEVDSRVLLVLGGALPTELTKVVGLLNIELMEKIKVPVNFQSRDSRNVRTIT